MAPNKHRKCACMPKKILYLQLNCFQRIFLVSKEKRTLPKCMVTVLWLVIFVLFFASPRKKRKRKKNFLTSSFLFSPSLQPDAGILTCIPFNRRNLYFLRMLSPQQNKKINKINYSFFHFGVGTHKKRKK